jgi:methionyl-tRNA synthetase
MLELVVLEVQIRRKKMNNKKFYISTAIAYTSAKPHLGNTYEIVLGDAIARYKRLTGYDVYFQTGCDEHGEKIESKAKAAGIKPQDFVDNISSEIKRIWDLMGASYDQFVRTTDPKHEQVVQDIFKKFYDQGDIYKGEYTGLYCTPCESFWTESQLVDGKCPDCGRDVHEMKEEAYFFRMSKYSKWLEEYINNHPDFIEPVARKNEIMNNFIKPGLKDLCVSRTSFDWGIPVTFDNKHIIYVWIDALSNYITFIGYQANGDSSDMFKKYWPADLHLIGKDILRFHTIYWPIMLHALGLELPHKIFGHPWLLFGNDKMSKSKGNIAYADDLVNQYGVDAVRYYLLHEIPFASDGNFTTELLEKAINSDLANNYGNLVNRTLAMINKYFNGIVPVPDNLNELDQDLIKALNELPNIVEIKMNEYHVSDAIDAIMIVLSKCNKYIDDTTPWSLAKDDEQKSRLGTVLYNLIDAIRICAILLSPFIPTSSDKVFKMLNSNKTSYQDLGYGKMESGIKLGESEVLFARIQK